MFKIQWRSNEGYGDFISGLCYAHSSVIKYQRPVHITFHWPNPHRHLLSRQDSEPIIDRFNYIKSFLRPLDGLTVEHFFSSIPPYRFINALEEFNPLHGFWYLKDIFPVNSKLVVFWSSIHNLSFPGYHKDPLFNYWDKVVSYIISQGYQVEEVTYRTPIKRVMELITTCEFGIGYEGMIHQLFKFTWRPLIVASQRVDLSNLLTPLGHTITEPKEILNVDISSLVEKSKSNISRLKVEHQNYLAEIEDPTNHKMYNKVII